MAEKPQTQTQGGGDKGGGVTVLIATPDAWDDDVIQLGDSLAHLSLVKMVQLRNYLDLVHNLKYDVGYAHEHDQSKR